MRYRLFWLRLSSLLPCWIPVVSKCRIPRWLRLVCAESLAWSLVNNVWVLEDHLECFRIPEVQ